MLLNLLAENWHIPPEIDQAAELSDYAVTSRYPGDFEEILFEEYREAVGLAELVVQWAQQIINSDRKR